MELYFIALVLPEALNQEILTYKNYMLEKYNCRVALKSPAHLTIIPPFWMEEEKEGPLMNDLSTFALAHFSFPLKTADFSCFKPRTIFIAVEPNEQLNELRKSADAFFEKSPFPVRIDSRPFHPHITIATRDLYKKTFAEAWPYFEKIVFKKEWKAENISLLKHNKKNWDVVHTSQFKNLW
jgi:2'-5' RNA ligase